MPDPIGVVPIHAIVIHAIIVLGPVAALFAAAYAIRPGRWPALRLPTLILAVLAGAFATVSDLTGLTLRDDLMRGVDKSRPDLAAALAQVHAHYADGDNLMVVSVLFTIVVLVALWRWLPAGRADARGAGARQRISAAVVVVLGAAMTAQVAITAYSGSAAVWARHTLGG